MKKIKFTWKPKKNKKNSKAFTLVEMLSTVVILAILLLIAVPAIGDIVERAKIDSYNRELEIIEGVARQYIISNDQTLCDTKVTVQELYDAKYLTETVKDPRTGENIHPDSFVSVSCVDGKQVFNFYNMLDDGEAPVISLNGSSSITLEKGVDTYNEEGATVSDNLEGDLTTSLQIDNDVDEDVVGVYIATYYVEDISGNSATLYRTINVVDTIEPPMPTLDSSVSVLTNTNLDISVSMTGDSVRAEYKIDESSWFDYSGPITINNNSIIYAKSYDGSGNSSQEAILNVTNIDKEPPVVNFSPNDSALVNNNIDVTISVSDLHSGLDYYTFETSIDNGVTWSSTSENLNGDTSIIIDQTGLNLIKVNAFDILSNSISTQSGIYAIDVDIPETPSITSSNTSATNENVTISFNYPVDGILKEYKIGSGSWTTYSGNVTLLSNTTVYARTFDEAGNESLTKSLTVANIDKVDPVVVFNNDSSWKNATTMPGNYVTTYSISDTGGSNCKEQYAIFSGSATAPSSITNGPFSCSSTSHVINSTDNGTYYLHMRVVDNAGNEAIYSSNAYNVDRIIPSGTFSPNERTSGGGDIDVVFNPSDSGTSGVHHYRSRISTNGGTSYNSWSAYVYGSNSNTVTMTTGAQNVIQFEVYDVAGNSNTLTSGTYVMDDEAPVIALTDTSVSITLGDSWTDSGISASDNIDGNITSSIVYGGSVNTNLAGDYTLTYNVTDAAGNVATQRTKIVTVEPIIEYSYRTSTTSCSTCYSTCSRYKSVTVTNSCPSSESSYTRSSGDCSKTITSKVGRSSDIYNSSTGTWYQACNHGGSLCESGASCCTYSTKYASYNTTYSCPSGYTYLSSSNRCRDYYSCNPYDCNCTTTWSDWSAYSTTVQTSSSTKEVQTREITSL